MLTGVAAAMALSVALAVGVTLTPLWARGAALAGAEGTSVAVPIGAGGARQQRVPRSGWRIATVLLVAAALSHGGMGLAYRYSRDLSRAHTVQYVVDADRGVATYTSPDPPGDAWVQQFIPARVDSRDVDTERQAPAPKVDFEDPKINVHVRSAARGKRRVELTLRSLVGARCLRLWQVSGPPVATLAVEGKAVTDIVRFSPEFDAVAFRFLVGDRSRRTWNLRHCGSGRQPVHFVLEARGPGNVELGLIEELDGLPNIAGRPTEPRPPGTGSSMLGDVSLIRRTVRF
jgi:hypothetical protein